MCLLMKFIIFLMILRDVLFLLIFCKTVIASFPKNASVFFNVSINIKYKFDFDLES